MGWARVGLKLSLLENQNIFFNSILTRSRKSGACVVTVPLHRVVLTNTLPREIVGIVEALFSCSTLKHLRECNMVKSCIFCVPKRGLKRTQTSSGQ